MWSVETVVSLSGERAVLLELHADHRVRERHEVPREELARAVAAREEDRPPRWVWADTRQVAPLLLAGGVRVGRCLDLRLCRAILAHAFPQEQWDRPLWAEAAPVQQAPTLWDQWDAGATGAAEQEDGSAVLAEFWRQQSVVDGAERPGRLRLLLAAESAGALVAAEILHDGLPWDRGEHEAILTEVLGPRPRPGLRPQHMAALAERVRHELSAPELNPDSPQELLRALRRVGVEVTSTSKWALREVQHPVIEPLLEYKRLARLLAASGWAWMDQWVIPSADLTRRGRFHPEYVPGGVITGRWATSGGGALQLPKVLRPAVRADPGWRLVVADAAQMEPRVLAAMSGDRALADAARGHDLYQGLVDAGVLGTRKEAKVAMLGALYGASSGQAGQLMPRLSRAYPRATAVVERAAREGERGGVVHTWLGRTSAPPPRSWHDAQEAASQPGASSAVEARARARARDWGRFTRNFVVQGTAAELALCWLGELRRRLLQYIPDGMGPHLVYFLHDEVIVHSPAALAEQVAGDVATSLTAASRLVFGHAPVDFPVQVATVENYGDADHG